MGLEYLNLFLSNDGYRFVGKGEHNGEEVFEFQISQVVTKDEGSELPTGTTFHITVLLRVTDLLPVSMHQTVELPAAAPPSPAATADHGGLPSTTVEYTGQGFVDRSSLPSDFFDPGSLGGTKVSP